MDIMDLKSVVTAFCLGLYDSCRGFFAIFYLDNDITKRRRKHNSSSGKQPDSRKEHTPVRMSHRDDDLTVKSKVAQCCMLNGAIALFSLTTFNYVLLPVLNLACTTALAKHAASQAKCSWLQAFLSLLFQTLWVVPLFTVCKFINNLWFQDIGQLAYRHSRGRSSNILSFSKTIADFIFSTVVESLFLIQAEAIMYLQFYYLERVVYLVHISLLYSLYAFEYKWVEMGWEIDRRLTSIETQWIYFIGFGLPLAIITQVFNEWMIKACIFSLLFPFYIISANEANPKPVESIAHIKIFSPVIALSNMIFSLLRKQDKSKVQRRG